jgi:hypothetical protein
VACFLRTTKIYKLSDFEGFMKDCKENESCLENFKKEYEKVKDKYKLPEFKLLAEEFDVERASERESSFVIREVRRAINDKLTAFLHMLETFMNPSQSSMFIFSMLKNVDENDKKLIKKVYEKVSRAEIAVLKLDITYNEKAEADFIKKIVEEWPDMKKDISILLNKLDNSFDMSAIESKRGYFG